MRDYGVVRTTFWRLGLGRMLRTDRDAQLVALYLMTSPCSEMSGLYQVSVSTMAEDVGLDRDAVRAAIGRLSSEAYGVFCKYDEANDLVWIPNLAREQVAEHLPATEKRKRGGVLKATRPFRRHPFYREFVELYREPYELGEAERHEVPNQSISKQSNPQDQDRTETGARDARARAGARVEESTESLPQPAPSETRPVGEAPKEPEELRLEDEDDDLFAPLVTEREQSGMFPTAAYVAPDEPAEAPRVASAPPAVPTPTVAKARLPSVPPPPAPSRLPELPQPRSQAYKNQEWPYLKAAFERGFRRGAGRAYAITGNERFALEDLVNAHVGDRAHQQDRDAWAEAKAEVFGRRYGADEGDLRFRGGVTMRGFAAWANTGAPAAALVDEMLEYPDDEHEIEAPAPVMPPGFFEEMKRKLAAGSR